VKLVRVTPRKIFKLMLSSEAVNLVDEFYSLTNKLILLKTNPVITKDQAQSFQTLLGSPKWNGQSALKIMSTQFISQYIHFFPEAHEAAINAQLDFCEDHDVKVRKESIKSLVVFAKSIPDYAGRVADVLLQLLQTSDVDELKVVNSTLLNCFQLYPRGICILTLDSLDALFHQIEHGVPLVRDRACSFLQTLLLPISAAGMKQKILSRFLPLLGKNVFTESELEVISLLLPFSKLSGTPVYNAQLEILYKKRLEAMTANPTSITSAKILDISKFYKQLFIVISFVNLDWHFFILSGQLSHCTYTRSKTMSPKKCSGRTTNFKIGLRSTLVCARARIIGRTCSIFSNHFSSIGFLILGINPFPFNGICDKTSKFEVRANIVFLCLLSNQSMSFPNSVSVSSQL
jgi:Apoptosis inhibitory protein 5 (API5)